ncbi:MAG: hypothetical protein V4557_10410 [Bacteroidota bacterium]
MRKWLLLLLLLITGSCFSQFSEAYNELKTFAQKKELVDTSRNSSRTRHYLLPLYKAFYNEQKLLKADTSFYIDNLKQSLSFTGDHASVLELEKLYRDKPTGLTKEYLDTLTKVDGEFAYIDARKYILSKAKNNRVVMINEAHDKPAHRAFTASLLEELYQQGFRYLAMEMLSNYRRTAITKLDAYTGYFTSEPIAGELIRKALELGYTLVPYEDTARNHTVNQREYAQAENLANFIKTHDTTAKILVHAGYGHIRKGASGDFIPMAAYFKIISGIEPLTIDQTKMTESDMNGFMPLVYDTWIRKHPTVSPMIALENNKPFDVLGTHLYDMYVIHPPTKYMNGRPTWVAMNGWRKETPVAPAFRSTFFVQAYYENEYAASSELSVPADQTYIAAQNGVYYLYLRKGKYKLVFRDKAYTMLGTKDIEVL